MPRIRTVKPSFWTDEKLADLPRDVRLLFLGLISAMADDEGRCKGNPRLVKAAVFPLDDDVTAAQVDEWLALLHAGERIQLYQANGERYVQIVKWGIHQRIDKPHQSQLPPPEESTILPRQLQDASPNGRGHVVEIATPDVEGELEGKGKRRSTSARGAGNRTWFSPYQDDFAEAYGEGSQLPVEKNVRDAKDLEQAHGRTEVRVRWRRMLALKDPDYVSFAMLKKMWGQLGEDSPSRGPPRGKLSAGEQQMANILAIPNLGGSHD